MLEKVLTFASESRESDARIATKMESLDKRIEAMEELNKTMALNLNEIKNLQTMTDNLLSTVNQNSSDIKELKNKYYEIENKSLKDKAGRWNTIVDSVFKTAVGLIIGAVVMKLGLGAK